MSPHIQKLCQTMLSAVFYPHDVTAIQKEETHISLVFLTGDWVYKIKKPVQLGFLDFSTLERRRFYCEQEVILNRRLSYDVYAGVVPITLENSRYQLNGQGPVVEYAVRMRQLSHHRMMQQLLQRGNLDARDLDRLAHLLVNFYQKAATGGSIDAMGTLSAVRMNCEENFEQTAEFAGTILPLQSYNTVKDATCNFFHHHSQWFDKRIDARKIRDGHGDLRAEHIYFTGDRIQIIDCIEFNERFRFEDVICNLAFLFMDLDYLGYSEAMRALYKAYLTYSDDTDSFNLLAFYQCYRAMVRVKVNCLRLKQTEFDDNGRQRMIARTHRYLALAQKYALYYSQAVIWVFCGMIATGKSTMARALGDALGLETYSSDRLRKTLIQDNGPVPFGKGIYTKQATDHTYNALLFKARHSIGNGVSVVLDATFGDRRHRDAVLKLARQYQARCLFVECICSETLLHQRLKQREEISETDSDARLEHLNPIRARYSPPEEINPEQLLRINTASPLNANLHAILARFT